MAHVEDRWHRRVDGKRVRSPQYGAGKRWRVAWTTPDGTRASKTCTTRDEADAYLAKIVTDLTTGTYIPPASGQVPFADVAERWYAAQVHQRASSRSVIRTRLDRHILPELGTMPIGSITRTHVQATVTAWSSTLAPATVKVAYVYLAGILALAVEDKLIATSPCKRINLPAGAGAPIEPLSVDDVQAIVDHLPDAYRPLALLMAASGLRPAEARGLTWDRVIPTGRGATLQIDRQLVAVTGGPQWGPLKTKSSVRSVGIGPHTLTALGAPGEGLVFLNGQGRPIARGLASQTWSRMRADVPQAGPGWHQLRHHHASVLIRAGASPVAVAARLGHKDPTETLRTYAHLWHDDDDRMRDATDGLVTLPTHAQRTPG